MEAMDNEVKILTEPAELLAWVADAEPAFQMNREGAEILLNYMEGHDYRVGIDAEGNMVRVDVTDVNAIMEEYSLDDLIDDVSEWNYELLADADMKRKDPENFIEFANEQARYEKLIEEEALLDALFDQTLYGKHLDELAVELATMLIAGIEADEELECSVGMVAEQIRNCSTDKGKVR